MSVLVHSGQVWHGGVAVDESEQAAARIGRVAVAILPSLQGYNRWGDHDNEALQVVPICHMLGCALGVFRDTQADVFWGPYETDARPGRYPMLREQVRKACTWLDGWAGDHQTLALHIHTDSGTGSRVGFYHNRHRDVDSFALGQRIAYEVLSPEFETKVVLQDDYGKQGYIAWSECPGHTALILELGSHVNPVDRWVLENRGARLAGKIAAVILSYYGVSRERVRATYGES